MLVATIKYDLFQRADVLHAAESPDALRPALKDSAERVITHSACKCRAEIIRRVAIRSNWNLYLDDPLCNQQKEKYLKNKSFFLSSLR